MVVLRRLVLRLGPGRNSASNVAFGSTSAAAARVPTGHSGVREVRSHCVLGMANSRMKGLSICMHWL